MSFESQLEATLASLHEADLIRDPVSVGGRQGPVLEIAGRQLLGLCSNNYLGLAGDPRIAERCAAALSQHGTGAAASRLISGTSITHRDAERCLAAFVGAPSALLFATGYAANTGTLQALAGEDDVIFSDQLNHASLIDGCRLSHARIVVYPHLELDRLASMIANQRGQHRNALVVTESLFSMDGDIAPLGGLRRLCDDFDCGLVVDEAHAVGVFGPSGRGLCAAAGVVPDVLVATLGKAFGVSGAFVAGSHNLVRVLEHRARSYVFSTAPPPAIAAAAIAATELVQPADSLRARVLHAAKHLRRELRGLGYAVPGDESQIIPVQLGEPAAAMRLAAALFELGVFVQAIRPPTVPRGTSRLRVAPTAAHSDAQLEQAIDAFRRCAQLR